ncbi:5'-3' exoribonuclease 1 [Hylaeus anthracinus]|uniref:5'-3' exoribonuclease 1 n=1 Tax=Hylaeus anthracinus TaxID=313031 RepID=UPI0023B90CD7|nr:5'-3' exoribonuclease 1 [Hylaeus anthracinus]
MGIPKFFRYISERYPCLSETLKDYQIPQFDNLYLDVNGIIHGCSHPDDSDVTFRITEEQIFKNIFHYIEILFRMIQPQKLFLIAIDGVAPRAKINHQRSRRFRSAKDAELQEANAVARGISIPKEKKFDSNCITPGTVFMSKLNEELNYFVTYKISTDKLWQKCKVIFSGSQVAGEGEHKIMDYIRYMKSQPGYDPHTKHCLYGLDADLIMLGLCTHEVYFTLLREEIQFGKKQTKLVTPEETKFCLFHLSLLREYIDHEFSPLKEKLPFPFDIEKIVDDWVLMGLLVGNDFIPHLPNLHITSGAMSILYNVYMEVLPSLDGYLNESGTLKLDRFEKFMERLSRFDILKFYDVYADLKYFESKTGRRVTESDRPSSKKLKDKETPSPKRTQDKEFDALLRSAAEISLGDFDDDELGDEDSDSETYNLEFVQHKRDYYTNKLEYHNIDEEFLRSQAEGYVRAVQWNLNYYYNGCCSWSWYYPHHYAPYISDIKDFKDLKLEFDLGEPFLPFQQLLAVLPPFSKDLLPEAFRTLLTEDKSPIIDYYPSDFRTDLNGKQQEWEAVVLIPFIDEKHLLDAMEPRLSELTPEEQARNKHGPMRMFTYTDANMGICKAPKYFHDFVSHASVQLINREDIIVPREKLVKGLCPGVNLDLYCPGFPTLKYIEHTTSLEKNVVKVFDRVTWRDSMILHIKPPPPTDLTSVASELLGKLVFVNWPYLTEAQVVGVSNCDTKLSLINPQMNYCYENINKEELKGSLVTQWNLQKKHIIEIYKVRLGVDVGETNILIHARPFVSSKYIYGSSGKLYFEKQWSDSQIAYAHQMIVKDISSYCVEVMLYKTIDDIFVPETVCFMLGHPHYGSMGKVASPVMCKKSGRIRVSVSVAQEPWLDWLKHIYQNQKTQYMPGSIAAQRLGISSHLLSRITGTIYVKSSDEFNPEETKYNVGLNLKFNKKNEEVLGYTRKENGQWLYSSKAVDLIHSYMAKCPDLFERLVQNVSNDVFLEENLFTKGSGTLSDIVAWLKDELQDLPICPCGTESFESDMVKKVEEAIDQFVSTQSNLVKLVPMQVKPHLLYKPGLHLRNVPPDPKAQTYLFDRICCTRENFTVPLGHKGTVIGIQKVDNALETMYDVLFDKTFPGGLVINGCSELRGYRLSPIDFINISHGERIEHGRARSVDGNTESIEGWRDSSNQKAQSCANASAFASYKKKIQAELPKLRIIQRNNEPNQECQLGPPPNAYRWKQCNMQNTVDSQDTYKLAKNVQQNAPSDNTHKKPATKPSLEFQALWNELHKLQTTNDQPKVELVLPMAPQAKQINKSFPESSPQDPSAFLKAVLKISDENKGQTKQPAPNPPLSNAVPKENKTLDTPPLVQQLFDHARQNDKVKDEKSPTWYCTQLLNYCLLKGVGMPRYSYFTDEKTNLVRSHILLPDKRVFVGDSCPNHEQAAGSAAEKVYTELNLVNILSNMNMVLPPMVWYPGGQNHPWLPNVLLPRVPFQPTKPQPHQHYLQWSMQVQHNPGYQPVPSQNNQYKLPPQPPSTQNPSKSEIKNSRSFVPLQAQKKSRNITAKQATTKEGKECAKENPQTVAQQKKKELPVKKVETVAAAPEKQKSVESNRHQIQNTSIVPKPKKSRVAAKFGIQSQTEETNHSKKST